MSRIQKDKKEVSDYIFRMFQLRAAGLTFKHIAETLGKLSHTTIWHQLRKYGETRKKIHGIEGKFGEPCFCRNCGEYLTRKTQTKFCGHSCSAKFNNPRKNLKRAEPEMVCQIEKWPEWIEDEQGNKVCTGKPYKEYLNEDKK